MTITHALFDTLGLYDERIYSLKGMWDLKPGDGPIGVIADKHTMFLLAKIKTQG